MLIDPSPATLLKELQILSTDYPFIVLFPTDDLHWRISMRLLIRFQTFVLSPSIKPIFLHPLTSILGSTWCDNLGVPRPKTVEIRTVEDIETISEITFPVLVKPKTRLDEQIKIFRNLHLRDEEDLRTHKETLKNFVLSGVSFIASEIIPGDGSNIYAYVGYQNGKGGF